jgi:glycosyltransferase involved in cell wall biosynthesis
MGAAYSRNIGIKAAVGEYVSFLDDDDEYYPKFLESTYNTLKNSSHNACFSWSSVEYKNYDGDPNQPVNSSFRIFAKKYSNIIKLYEELCSIGIGHGFSIKTSCIKDLGGFDESFKTVEDADLFFRLILAHHKPIVIPEVSMIIHKHNLVSLTHLTMHSLRIKECNKLLIIYSELLNNYPMLKENLIAHVNNLNYEILYSKFKYKRNDHASI